MIERVRIQGFRSLHDVTVELAPLTVLIGRSGTGKSNVVGALRLLRDYLRGQAGVTGHQPFGQSKKPFCVEVTVRVKTAGQLGYVLEVDPSGVVTNECLMSVGRTIFHQGLDRATSSYRWIVEPPVVPRPQPGATALSRLTGVRESTIAYVALTRGIGCYDFPGNVLQSNLALDVTSNYGGTGETVLTVAGKIVDNLDRLSDWRDVGKSLAALSGRIVSLDLVVPDRNQLRVGYRLGDKTLMVDVAQESEGFRRYLAHLLALYQTPSKQTLVFEHPESGIHPGAMEALAEEFRTHVQDGRGQVILTTHSPQFLDYFEAENVRAVVMDDDGRTHVGKVAADQYEALHKGLMTAGDLLTLDPARLDEPAAAEAGA